MSDLPRFDMGFQEAKCMECERDRAFWNGDGDSCEIAARAVAYGPEHEDFPALTVIVNEDGDTECLDFVPLGSRVPTDTELEAAGQMTLEVTA